jgi:hypothetical protein
MREDRPTESRIIHAMPALAHADPLHAEVAPQPEVAEPVAEAHAGEISTEGAVPEVSETGGVVEPGTTASEQAFGDKPTKQSGDIDGGMFDPRDYHAAVEAAGTPDKWDDRYYGGHTAAPQFEQPYELGYDNTFKLKPGQSASGALKDFLAGPTLTDWKTVAVALEMEEVRFTLGNDKFDKLFGSRNAGEDAQIPKSQRMQISISMYTIPFAAQMEALADKLDEVPEQAEEAPAPQVAAQVEDKPLEGGVTSQPAPELVAEEMGVNREQEFA